MPPQDILESIVNTFKEFDLQVTTPKSTQELPYNAALVDFGTDEENRSVVLQVLHYSHDILSSIEELSVVKSNVPISILSFLMTVPVNIPENTSNEVLRLISLANKAIPIGAFNYSAAEKGVYYSYNIPIHNEPPAEIILATILHTSLFVKDTFFMSVDLIAQGKETVESLMQEEQQTVNPSSLR